MQYGGPIRFTAEDLVDEPFEALASKISESIKKHAAKMYQQIFMPVELVSKEDMKKHYEDLVVFGESKIFATQDMSGEVVFKRINPALEGGLILGGYMKEQALEAYESAQKSLAEALYDAGFADGSAVDVAEVQAKLADALAKIAEVEAKLTEAQVEIAKVKSDDESDKAAIAEGHAKLEAIKSILSPKVEVPVDPAPVQEQTGEAQP